MDCNPCLGIAASLICGYLGIVEELCPSKRHKGEACQGEILIPCLMDEALDNFDSAPKLHALLGQEFSGVYSAIKRAEYDKVFNVISPWEREHLLMHV